MFHPNLAARDMGRGVTESGERRIEGEMQNGDRIVVVGKEVLEELGD